MTVAARYEGDNVTIEIINGNVWLYQVGMGGRENEIYIESPTDLHAMYAVIGDAIQSAHLEEVIDVEPEIGC